MTSDTSAPTANTAANDTVAPQPLFYAQPEPLLAGAHKEFKIRPEFDFAFAANTNTIPLTVIEFTLAARHFPIIFLGPELIPAAAVGFVENRNFFVNSKGEWEPNTYVPAYVRRYPFIFLGAPDAEQFSVGIDSAARSKAEGARALFDGDKETETLTKNIQFCQEFHGAFLTSRDVSKELKEAGIMEETGIELKTPSGQTQRTGGFYRVNEEKYLNLPEATVVRWHKIGLLAAVAFHLQSQANWDLLTRKGVEIGALV